MNQENVLLRCWIFLCIILLPSVYHTINAQEQKKNRYNIEWGTGLSAFKNIDGNSPNVASSTALSMWTTKGNIFSLEAFFTFESGKVFNTSVIGDYYTDFSVLYGKMLPFKMGKKGFASIHGGIGYLNILKKSYNVAEFKRKTVGLTAQLKTGWAFEKGVVGLTLFQKYSFAKNNNITGVCLLLALNLNTMIPR